uniref:Protein adenylyltransferase Fic n=1 Tax=Clastoptera arizonana TaxID=38151 RepID=A0A1B6DIV6_9HEMI
MYFHKWCVRKGIAIKSVVHRQFDKYTSHFMNSARLSRLAFMLVFIFGVIFAAFIAFLFNYVGIYKELVIREKVFYPLPFESKSMFTSVLDEEKLQLSVRKANVEPSAINEALSTLHVALDLKKMGKLEKALRLIEHALALAPKHPDILNHYGELLEESQKDIIQADQMYFQALTNCPDHSKALANRNRVMQVVEEIDKEVFQRIDKKRDTVSAIPDSNTALQRAKKEAYFQHIYHTVGIEGNTMSLSQTRFIVENRIAVGGKSIAEHNEILGLDAAMKYINSTLISRLGGITVEDILEIHRRVLGFVDPFDSGTFRRTQVFVGGHIPPRPRNIPPLMEQFAEWLNSDSALRLHPVQFAALAHYKLVHIHPFTDGNGRTSRLLMNMILMQAGFPPVIILKQNRHRYYRMLEIANEGDVRPFIRFIAECTEQTLDLFLWSTTEYASDFPAIGSSARTIIVEE